jgi:hypothetical protein
MEAGGAIWPDLSKENPRLRASSSARVWTKGNGLECAVLRSAGTAYLICKLACHVRIRNIAAIKIPKTAQHTVRVLPQ